tara:strand:+ start:1823 stop:2647 length:825 start_codon:yes stop_codon:yes gene_type:complete
MSSGGGGGGGGTPANTTNVQTIREAPEIEARRLGLMDEAAKAVADPLALPAFQVAPMSAGEQMAITQAQQTGLGLPSIQAAEDAAQLVDPTSKKFQDFLNPYQSFITDEINRQADIRRNELAANAVRGGSFGGGREGIAIGELERARFGQIGQAQEQAFRGALGAFQSGQQLQAQTNLAAAQARQTQQQQDLQNLASTGGLQRSLEQARMEAERQSRIQEITDPFQRLSFLSDIQRGVPSTQSNVQQGFAPTTSPFGQAVATGIGAYSAFAPRN